MYSRPIRLALFRLFGLIALVLVPLPAQGQVNLSLPLNLDVQPGQTIQVPVVLTVIGPDLNAANGNGIGAASFVINYNSALTTGVGTIQLGSLISDPGFGFANYTTNNTNGLIRAITSSTIGTEPLNAGTSGTIALVPLTISPDAALGNYPIEFLASSGLTTSSIVDNNFNTLQFGNGLTFTGGQIHVVPVPEPGVLAIAVIVLMLAAVKGLTSQSFRALLSASTQLRPFRRLKAEPHVS